MTSRELVVTLVILTILFAQITAFVLSYIDTPGTVNDKIAYGFGAVALMTLCMLFVCGILVSVYYTLNHIFTRR